MGALEQPTLLVLPEGILTRVPAVSGMEHIPLCTAPGEQYGPAIDRTRVVRSDNRTGTFDIHPYHIGSGVEALLTTDPADRKVRAISGDRVVWENYRNGKAGHLHGRSERTPRDRIDLADVVRLFNRLKSPIFPRGSHSAPRSMVWTVRDAVLRV